VSFSILPANAQKIAVNNSIEKDAEAIRSTISAIANFYNQGTPDSVLIFYAKDIRVSYPGLKDTDYEGFEVAYKQMKNNPGVSTFTRDSIEEIIVSADLAMVRLSWLTTQVYSNPVKTVSWRARDFTIWRRGKNGQWKFSRGMWFREKPVEGK